MHPNKVGRYEIKAELGRGGMATVYRAYDPMFEREVAIKILPLELMHDSQFRGRFEREAKIIARLEHAAIVPVYDVGQENDQPYLVMRYMSGGSLSDRMGNGPISLEECARITRRVAAALDYAHSKGIIHRDLKPANILFDETGDPFISDYGIAKLAQSQTNLTGSSIIGTPTYMSPEQGQGEDIDGRSDIYSLGVILYEMLSGTLPYDAKTPLGVVFKHVTEPIPHILDANPKLPTATESVIEKALAKNRDDRFASAMDLAVALGSLVRGEIPDLDRTVPLATHLHLPALSRAGKSSTPDASAKSRLWVLGGVGVLIIAALLWGAARFAAQSEPPTATTTAATAIIQPVVIGESVETLTPTPTETLTPTETPTPSATEAIPLGIGGADTVAFISGNNIWIMNIDGSDPTQLTNDSNTKFDLQWLPDGKNLVYMQEKCVFLLDSSTRTKTQITCFNGARYFEGFRVSPDGEQVAISVDRQLYVVPFDLTALANVHDWIGVAAMKGCLSYVAASAKNSLWSTDGQKLALMYLMGQNNGKVAETIRVMDIHQCNNGDPLVLDEFPAKHFTPESYAANPVLSSFSWDGNELFLFNTLKRNEGYGALYTYDLASEKENKINPINGSCCYRDARFSPDGQFMIFAFQDLSLGAESTTHVYYIPVAQIGSDTTFEPIKMPLSLLTDPRGSPQFALHPVSAGP